MNIYLTFIEFNEVEGITKKVISQSIFFSQKFDTCVTYFFGRKSFSKLIFEGGFLKKKFSFSYSASSSKSYLINLQKRRKKIIEEIKTSSTLCSSLYIRNFFPWLKILLLFNLLKKQGKKIYLEIPTWPYLFEQIFNSKYFFFAIIKYSFENLFIILFHTFFTKVFYIKSRKSVLKFRNFHEILNGFNTLDNFNDKSLDKNVFNIVGVGSIHKYHGYDLMIRMIHKYILSINNLCVNLYIIGNGPEINKLKRLSHKLNIEDHIFFMGMFDRNRLMEIYSRANLGLGTLKLKYRLANIDSAIKNIEFLCNNVPFVSSGKLSRHDIFSNYYITLNKFTKLEDLISFSDEYFKTINKDKLIKLLNDNYSWSRIYFGVFN